jgi:hypothetical protein
VKKQGEALGKAPRDQEVLTVDLRTASECFQPRFHQVTKGRSTLPPGSDKFLGVGQGMKPIHKGLELTSAWSINLAARDILGYAPDELVGKTFYEFVPREHTLMQWDMLNRKLKGEVSTQYDHRPRGTSKARMLRKIRYITIDPPLNLRGVDGQKPE